MRRRLVRAVGWSLSAACLAFFVLQAQRTFSNEALALTWSSVWGPMALAMAPYMLAYAALAVAWYFLLRAIGLRPSLRRAVGIYFSTQVGKYLPGNVGQHVGRVYLSARHGLPPFRVGVSLAIEMGLVILVAAALSLPLAPMLLAHTGGGLASPVYGIAAALFLVASAAVYLFRRHPMVVLARHHAASAWREARMHGSVRFLPAAIVLIAFALVLVGGSLLLLVDQTRALGSSTLVKAVALVSASWIAGFLTPGAPAGLGVREAILLVGLGTLVSRQDALEATLLLRGLSTAADLLAFAFGTLLLRSAGAKNLPADGAA